MGGGLVTDLFSPSLHIGEAKKQQKTHAEIFADLCPTYLAIGMTYDQYWHGAAEVARYYREAYRLKQKAKNRELWMQGMYFYEALIDVAPIMVAFPKKGAKPTPYSEEPYPISEEELREREELKERKEAEKLRAALKGWAAKTNAYFAAQSKKQIEAPQEVNTTDA